MKLKTITVILTLMALSPISFAKNVCTPKSFDGLNGYIQDSFDKKHRAQKNYKEKVAEYQSSHIPFMSKTGISIKEFMALYMRSEPSVKIILKQQEELFKHWSDDFKVIEKDLKSCIYRLKKVLGTLDTLYNSCKEYGNIEGMVASSKNITTVENNLKVCEQLKKKFTRVNSQLIAEFELRHDVRKRAEYEESLSDDKKKSREN